ncbi:hypothetical protein K0B96_16065 [Horticoccus luteus]|uniref:Uncharacterized protein n=1 Tax=Horticoccus luteus TaxID=2862869 RepID=A0A8F9TW11_9BACT|nr:hypothetical protein [Horticoccus luteus]QYM78798.1 hypothetical protein K0B96_16065 [Horticoccus luteus]
MVTPAHFSGGGGAVFPQRDRREPFGMRATGEHTQLEIDEARHEVVGELEASVVAAGAEVRGGRGRRCCRRLWRLACSRRNSRAPLLRAISVVEASPSVVKINSMSVIWSRKLSLGEASALKSLYSDGVMLNVATNGRAVNRVCGMKTQGQAFLYNRIGHRRYI